MEEAGGRECEESRVKDRGSWRLNEMEERCESDCRGDKVYPVTLGNKKKTGLKLDGRRSIYKVLQFSIYLLISLNVLKVILNYSSLQLIYQYTKYG